MIPFLEHDDANRALMGSNMQRQAVPLLVTDAPLVGTGMERRAAIDTGDVVVARAAGHRLLRRRRADRRRRQGRRPGRVRAPEVHALQPGHADPPEADRRRRRRGRRRRRARRRLRHRHGRDGAGQEPAGRLHVLGGLQLRGRDHPVQAPGRTDDELTSIHIEEYEIDARTTKLGDEEITRDIPNRSEESLRNLDDRGIVRIGAEVGVRRPARRQGHAQGRDRADRRGEADPRDLQGEGARGPRHLAQGAPRRGRRRDRRQDLQPRRGRRPAAGRQRPGPRVRGQEAQDRRGRQARRPSRQQGRDLEDRRRRRTCRSSRTARRST